MCCNVFLLQPFFSPQLQSHQTQMIYVQTEKMKLLLTAASPFLFCSCPQSSPCPHLHPPCWTVERKSCRTSRGHQDWSEYTLISDISEEVQRVSVTVRKSHSSQENDRLLITQSYLMLTRYQDLPTPASSALRGLCSWLDCTEANSDSSPPYHQERQSAWLWTLDTEGSWTWHEALLRMAWSWHWSCTGHRGWRWWVWWSDWFWGDKSVNRRGWTCRRRNRRHKSVRKPSPLCGNTQHTFISHSVPGKTIRQC